MQFEINYWAVLVSGIAAMVTGFLWYGPLFSRAWAKEMGFDKYTPEQNAQMREKAKTAYPQQFIGALLMAFIFAHVLQAFGAQSVADGLAGAVWVWLGFIAPVKWGETLWGGKSKKLFFIDSLYLLINLVVFSVILVLWK